MKVVFDSNERYIGIVNSILNEGFADVLGNKLDTASAVNTASVIAKLTYIIENTPDTTDFSELIGAINTVAHTGVVDDITTLFGYIKQLVTDLRVLKGDWDNGGRLDLLIDSLTTGIETISTAVVTTIPEVLTAIQGTLTKTQSGKKQTIETTITNAANFGLINVFTCNVSPIIIKSVILSGDGATQIDLTSAAVTSINGAFEFISAINAIKTNLDTIGKQVSFVGASRIAVGQTIDITLVGSDITPVGLILTIEYCSVNDGGNLTLNV